MTITKEHVVELEYTLTDDKGTVLDTSNGNQPLAYLHGAKNIIPGLEKQLEGCKQGDELQVIVSPEEGYGPRTDQLINEVPKDELQGIPELKVGLQLQGQSDQGTQVFTVIAIKEDTVTLDGNHPLAGMTLNFEVKVLNVRAATEEEISHGHAHTPDSHRH